MSLALRNGIDLLRQGRLTEAGAEFAAAVGAEPANALALHLAGFVQLQTGQLQAGLDSIRRAIAINPRDPAAFGHLGRGLYESGAHHQAIEAYDRALSIDPRMSEAWRGRGKASLKAGLFDIAAASFAKARALGAPEAAILLDRAEVEWEADRLVEALALYDSALAADPGVASGWANRAMVLRLLERHDEALHSINRAIGLAPSVASHLGDRAIMLSDLGRYDEALRDFENCLTLDPEFRRIRPNYAFACLAKGDFERGWALFEARFEAGLSNRPEGGPPPWDGVELLAGKTILMRHEQGLGDALQFCRYASDLKAMGARVLVETQPPLVALFGTLAGVDGVSVMSEPLPEADLQCPLMSMPLLMGTRIESIPGSVPYLRADRAKVEAWRRRLGPAERLRVGLVWSGGERFSPTERWVNRRRNISLALLAPLNGLDVDFISLQKGEPAESELRAAKRQGWDGPDIVETADGLLDFSDTAALIETLDLVISVDTSTAHLAGALGKPVWVLSRYDTCWRWLTDRDDSPWYPSLRLFRQARFSDWEAVVARVRSALAALALDAYAR